MPEIFTLARFDRDPLTTFTLYFYDESVSTLPITHKGQSGVKIELTSHYSVQRALQMGWKNITEELNTIKNSKKLEIPEKITVTEEKPKPKRRTRKK